MVWLYRNITLFSGILTQPRVRMSRLLRSLGSKFLKFCNSYKFSWNAS